ncbi:hypothetical protein MYCTH_2296433 [Thermothelomyces thermophilus ATCC 42464]|uniref:Cytochrome P450 n=1 Tax=Thermothelomyces thermophilus (strain ATCC 42464 / BCRC 31852 / DSM 1799) TaxID=573729 RepID=G2Q1U3_THET4|nr:uncharacterized protein MYCTH_2296433 [Thermothelomyces thermophilus ATCC 42464]AEO54175.1 hypothetical protein MYCTH_2296433 [Thermothelomyces thermophilus ATCC 42464]
MFSYRLISGISLGGAYLVSSGRIPQWPSPGFLTAFTVLWGIQGLAWALWSVILYPKLFSPLRGLPEPSGNSWFMGQFPKILAMPTGNPMIEWINSIPNNGLIRYLGPLNRERLLVTSPKALAEVLVTKNYDFVKPDRFRHTLGPILGTGLLLAEGDEHKMQRKNLSPAFAFRHIKDLYPVFWAKAREGVNAMTGEILRAAAGQSGPEEKTAVIEAGNWASRITLDIIGVAGMGRDFDAIRNPDNRLNQAYTQIFNPSRQARIFQVLEMIISPRLVRLLPVKRNEDIQASAGLIRAECADLIRDKRQKIARKESTDVDILSVAIESGGFSDEDLVDQLMTFLAAGHETTATAMTWAAYLLAKHPDVQSRLRAEVREHLPPPADGAPAPSSADIDRMPYLNAVCSEVLRYFSPAPFTLRTAAKDTSILGQFVPRGTQVTIVPWAINKSEALWGDDALVFNPDRWMPKSDADKRAASGGATSNYAFLTFLHGPRSCIGMAFAKAEFACLLATWVGRFQWELHDKELMDESKLVIKTNITARPAKGMYIKTTVLDGW